VTRGVVEQPDDSVLCMKCRTPALDRIEVDDRELYICRNCGHEDGRALYTKGLRVDFLEDGSPKHYSVGALIKNGEKILVIERRVWPYKYGLPAGHVDEHEDGDHAIVREMQEELGVSLDDFEVIAHEPQLVGDKCRKGADVHDWALYRCQADVGAVQNRSDEAKRLLWVTSLEASSLDFAFASGHMLRSVGLIR
jgi:8-oxo-dGTP pyrophosphatase MutT (NUDIX family)